MAHGRITRIVFMGTAELSCDSLRGLLAAPGFRWRHVVTQPDRPKRARLSLLQPSPVKELGLQAGLPVLQPERARSRSVFGGAARAAAGADRRGGLWPDTAAGHSEPAALWHLNVHTSLLPVSRRRADQWAILNGETETGVTIMKMDAGLDTGAF